MRFSAKTSSQTDTAAYLYANSESYEWLVGKMKAVNGREKAEDVLRKIEQAALFAGRFHTGRFADGAIENVALEIGADLDKLAAGIDGFDLPVACKDSRRRVLHVTPQVLGIGGHTRMLYHWVRYDTSSCHSLVLMDQGDKPIPSWLSEALQCSGGNLVVFLPNSSLLQKARWLREIARGHADLVLLHHGFSDVVPTVAFAARQCPPVVVLNHADHLFWLGSSVADMVINLRTAGSEHSEKRRFISYNTVIPIPLALPVKQVSRLDARRALGIPEDQVMLLSIGRDIKYWPCGSYDFVATANKILDRQPSAQLYIVGESAKGIAPYLRNVIHDRLHFIGSIEEPSLYRAAADIYIESFPFGSQTALLEAALSGLPVVPAYAPLFQLLVANDDALQDILTNPRYEQEYVERVELLIQKPNQRVALGKKLRQRLLIGHVGEGWLDRLSAIYLETDQLIHNPQQIPASVCNTTDADIGLGLWNVIADGKTNTKGLTEDPMSTLLHHTVFVAKAVGDYTKARRIAWRAIRYAPYHRVAWRLFAVTLLGRSGRFIRRVLRRG
jgi:glycosyltransferase involved in cell wall biosynthesis